MRAALDLCARFPINSRNRAGSRRRSRFLQSFKRFWHRIDSRWPANIPRCFRFLDAMASRPIPPDSSKVNSSRWSALKKEFASSLSYASSEHLTRQRISVDSVDCREVRYHSRRVPKLPQVANFLFQGPTLRYRPFVTCAWIQITE